VRGIFRRLARRTTSLPDVAPPCPGLDDEATTDLLKIAAAVGVYR